MKSLGQIAYEAFVAEREGYLLSPWERLPQKAKIRWERVAQAVKSYR